MTFREKRTSVVRIIPNVLSCARMILAGVLCMVEPLSSAFFAVYLGCGLSDALDGFLARRLGVASRAGAVLDSVGDILFVGAALIVLLPLLSLPAWLWWWILGIAMVRMLSVGVGVVRFRAWAVLHTWANKATGLALFCCPLLFVSLGVELATIGLCVVATVSALEELLLNATSPQLDLNVRGPW